MFFTSYIMYRNDFYLYNRENNLRLQNSCLENGEGVNNNIVLKYNIVCGI